MASLKQDELVTLAAHILGVDPAEAIGGVLIVAMADGSVGLTSTGPCECMALQIISRAIERLSTAMHLGETPDDDNPAGGG